MKLGKRDIALAGTTGATITLGTLYGTSQTKVEEKKEEIQIQHEVKEVIKEVVRDNPETLKTNEALRTTVTGLTSEKEDLQSNLNTLNGLVLGLREEKEYSERGIDQLEDQLTAALKRNFDKDEEIGNLKVALADALDRLISKDYEIEALGESIKSLESTIDGLDEENTRLNELLYEIEETNDTLRDQLRLWVHAYTTKQSSLNNYTDALVKMLGQQRKSNPLSEEVGCGYSTTSESDANASYGLNCPSKKVIGQDNKEYSTMTVAWAKKSDHPQLGEYFKKRYQETSGKALASITR